MHVSGQAVPLGEPHPYRTGAGSRFSRLQDLFSGIATEFLGIPCLLESISRESNHVPLQMFVPVFNGERRTRPEDCSEAQRFFLDIAFRLAVLRIANELSGLGVTFICETPESALDVSYVDNAAKMFGAFAERGNSIVATTNIQRFGLAQQLLTQARVANLEVAVFDLLDHGRPSTVQGQSDALREIKNEILKGLQ